MLNENNKGMHVRFVAAPSVSSQPSKIMTTDVAPDGLKSFVVNVIEGSFATSVINTLLDSSNG